MTVVFILEGEGAGGGVNRHSCGFLLPALTMQTSTSYVDNLIEEKIGFGG